MAFLVRPYKSGSPGLLLPEIDRLIKISNCFGLSLDALIKHNGRRVTEELASHNKIFPNYGSLPAWEAYSSGLTVEYRQSYEEGLDVGSLEGLFQETAGRPAAPKRKRLPTFDPPGRQCTGPLRTIPIQSRRTWNRSSYCGMATKQVKSQLLSTHSSCKVKSRAPGWAESAAVCSENPLRAFRTNELHSLLKASGNFPMRRYILSTDITAEMLQQFNFPLSGRCYADTVERAPVDDDTNYTVLAQAIIERSGLHFTPQDVANAWLDLQGKNAYCTAERVAYCNLIRGYTPPASAKYKNPYREWIGAQIRGDYYGYIHPGRPESAPAEMAWRVCLRSPISKMAFTGKCLLPPCWHKRQSAQTSKRFSAQEFLRFPAPPGSTGLFLTACWRASTRAFRKSVRFDHIHRIYDEHSPHDWCHTLSNAMIVASALLYGSGDISGSLSARLFRPALTRICNGATVGSVLGNAERN